MISLNDEALFHSHPTSSHPLRVRLFLWRAMKGAFHRIINVNLEDVAAIVCVSRAMTNWFLI